MAETKTARSAALADQFEDAQKRFIQLVESLSEEQWWFQGVNTPGIRLNDEDEVRREGVIAHHVAATQPWIMGRIRAVIEDKPAPMVDFKVINAEHAVEHRDASKAEALGLLGQNIEG